MTTAVSLKIPVTIFKEGETFIAYSPVLDLATSASKFGKVQTRFQEVVKLFFEEITAKGTVDEVLSSLGWQKVRRQWNPPIPVSHQMTDVSVSLPS